MFHPQAGNFPLVYIHTCSAIIDLPFGGYTGFKISESSWITPCNLQKHGNLHQPNTLPVLPFKLSVAHTVLS